jgi:hypothetical protein
MSVLLTISSQAVASGATLATGWVTVPPAWLHVVVNIDGTLWPAGTVLDGHADISEDGGNSFHQYGAIHVAKPFLIGGWCSCVLPPFPLNANASRRIRAFVACSAGPGFNLLGNISDALH